MSCGVVVIRVTDWAAIDREVRDIMMRVWGVEPIEWNGRIILPAGRQTAMQKLRASVQEVREMVQQPKAITSQPTSAEWLTSFIREHEEHEHPALTSGVKLEDDPAFASSDALNRFFRGATSENLGSTD